MLLSWMEEMVGSNDVDQIDGNPLNNRTMTSTKASATILRLCRFEDDPLAPRKPYMCFPNEVCCKEGCCTNYGYKYFQTWYFWLIVLVVFALYRYFTWYCKRIDERSRARPSEAVAPPILNRINPYLVDRVIVSYSAATAGANDSRNANKVDEPPLYNVAVNLPKPPTDPEQVPTYEQATALG